MASVSDRAASPVRTFEVQFGMSVVRPRSQSSPSGQVNALRVNEPHKSKSSQHHPFGFDSCARTTRCGHAGRRWRHASSHSWHRSFRDPRVGRASSMGPPPDRSGRPARLGTGVGGLEGRRPPSDRQDLGWSPASRTSITIPGGSPQIHRPG